MTSAAHIISRSDQSF